MRSATALTEQKSDVGETRTSDMMPEGTDHDGVIIHHHNCNNCSTAIGDGFIMVQDGR